MSHIEVLIGESPDTPSWWGVYARRWESAIEEILLRVWELEKGVFISVMFDGRKIVLDAGSN
jgi:hypothetical protein